MKRILFFSMLLCCTFFCGQTALAQTAKKACTPEQIAACAKVCDTRAQSAVVGLTPKTVSVAHTAAHKVSSDCKIASCDPADCPLICQILCPIICGPQATTTAFASEAAVPSCKPKPSCVPAQSVKKQMASIE